MTLVSVSGTVRQAYLDVPWTGVELRALLSSAYHDGATVVPTDTIPLNAGDAGVVAFKALAPATGTTAYAVEAATAFGTSTYETTLADDDNDLTFSEFLASGGTPPAGGTIALTGHVLHAGGGVAWAGGTVKVSLDSGFVTVDGLYLPGAWTITLDEDGKIYGDDGVTLAVLGELETVFTITLPDGSQYTIRVDSTASTVDLSGIVAGEYATWIEPMVAPSNVALAVGGTNRDEVTITWDDNSSDETGFEVEYYDGTWNLLTTTAAGVETYTHTIAHGTHPLDLGLAALSYRVRAVKSGGASARATKTETAKGLLFRLKAALNLNEASGTRADILGGYPLTQEVGAAGSATGLIGDAVDGSDNVRLNNDNYTIPSGTPFAIALWVYWGGSSGAGNRITGLYPNATGELLRIITGASNTLVIDQVNGSSATLADVDLAEWNLIVFGYDGTNTVYSVNGAAKQTFYAGAWPQDWSRLWVGSENTNSTYLVDLLNWYYDHFPSAAQIAALYNSGAGLAYPFS